MSKRLEVCLAFPEQRFSSRTTNKNFSDDQKVSASLARKHGFVTAFSPNEEAALVTYLITSLNMCYGLTEIEARKLAYQFALANKKKMPQAWVDHEKAGKE